MFQHIVKWGAGAHRLGNNLGSCCPYPTNWTGVWLPAAC